MIASRHKRARFRLDRRASVAVEFALCSSFVLLPLFAGGADFVEIISAQAQLNTTLQSLYLYAYANPTAASYSASNPNITAVIGAINAATHQVTFPANNAAGTANGAVSHKCLNSSGAFGTYSAASPPCATGYTAQTYVSYQLNCNVSVTVPLPFGLSNPVALRSSGTVQIQ